MLQVLWNDSGTAQVTWNAPWPEGPQPPQPPGRCWGLWEYPVIELFLASERGPYVELEFGAAGHWLALYLTDYRVHSQGLDGVGYTWWRSGDRWLGKARLVLPGSHRWTRGNAFLITQEGLSREYLAAAGVPGTKPDFHRLDCYLTL